MCVCVCYLNIWPQWMLLVWYFLFYLFMGVLNKLGILFINMINPYGIMVCCVYYWCLRNFLFTVVFLPSFMSFCCNCSLNEETVQDRWFRCVDKSCTFSTWVSFNILSSVSANSFSLAYFSVKGFNTSDFVDW